MTSTERPSADRLGQARQRLERALDRLDSALAERAAHPPPPPVDTATEAELHRLRDENDRLRETTHTVARRLESTIGRLKSVLEG